MARKRLLTSTTLAALIFMCAFPISAIAISAQEPAVQPELSSVLAQAANRRWFVRVVLTEQDSVVGNVFRVSSGNVRVADQQFAINRIQTLERRVFEGGGARSGAIIGATSLGLLGGAFAIGFCGYGNGECNERGALALGAAGGALIGAVLGGLIGKAARPGNPSWIVMWPGES